MHRTKRSNCAVHSSSSSHAALKQQPSKNEKSVSPTIDSNNIYTRILNQNKVGITNVHQLISNQKMMTMKKNKSKKNSSKSETIAPETALTPPSTPSSPTSVNDNFDYLFNSWAKFTTAENGKPDTSIKVYVSSGPTSSDFEPFNIDRSMAEALLKELDIDPKYAIF